jgi:hypothetical protein
MNWTYKSNANVIGKITTVEYLVKDDANDNIVATTYTKSNAKLVSAAPELFDYLHEALDILEKSKTFIHDADQPSVEQFLSRAYAVIFKVED